MTDHSIPAAVELIEGQEADELFLAAIEGADAQSVEHVVSWRGPDGRTFTRTAGRYGDGQSCDGVHVRDADGEFVEFVAGTA